MKIPVTVFCVLLQFIAVGTAAEEAKCHSPSTVASAYLDAMESGDLDAAEKLFGDASSIFESGGQEGTWEHYREHHLGPEVDAVKTFAISRGEPELEESGDGDMAFVAWPIEYRIELEARTIESKGTVTFVLTRGDDGAFKIRHLHWSSRPRRR